MNGSRPFEITLERCWKKTVAFVLSVKPFNATVVTHVHTINRINIAHLFKQIKSVYTVCFVNCEIYFGITAPAGIQIKQFIWKGLRFGAKHPHPHTSHPAGRRGYFNRAFLSEHTKFVSYRHSSLWDFLGETSATRPRAENSVISYEIWIHKGGAWGCLK